MMKKTEIKRPIAIVLVILLTAFIFSCGGGGSSSSISTGKTSVTLSVGGLKAGAASSGVPDNVASLKFTVSGPGMDTIQDTVTVTDHSAPIVKRFPEVPNGNHRRFLVEAFAQDGKRLYQGDQFEDLNGVEKNIAILMAYEVSGPWTFDLGQTEALFTFTQTGNSLSFTATMPDTAVAAASSDKRSASVVFTGIGTINGDTIVLTGDGPVECGQPLHLTVTIHVTGNGSSMTGTLILSGGCLTSPQTFSLTAVQGNTLPQFDVTGTWSVMHRPQGQAEKGPDFFSLIQTNNAVTFTITDNDGSTGSGTGNVNGADIQLTISTNTDKCGNPAPVTLTGTISQDGNSMTGSYSVPGTSGNCASGETGTWTASKAQPTTFNLSGGWSGFHTPSGGSELGPDCSTLAQNGNLITSPVNSTGSLVITGMVSGNAVDLVFTGNNQNCKISTHLTGTIAADGNSISGNYTTSPGEGCSGSPETGTWRMIKGTSCVPSSPVDVIITLP